MSEAEKKMRKRFISYLKKNIKEISKHKASSVKSQDWETAVSWRKLDVKLQRYLEEFKEDSYEVVGGEIKEGDYFINIRGSKTKKIHKAAKFQDGLGYYSGPAFIWLQDYHVKISKI